MRDRCSFTKSKFHSHPSLVLSNNSMALMPPGLVPVMFDQTLLSVPGIDLPLACFLWYLTAVARCFADVRRKRHH